MAFRNNFALLLLFGLLLLLFSSKICRAKKSHVCPPSSCGSIRNISYPFRLKDEPENCGDPGYELVCENNRTTIYLNSKKFIVQSITYHNFTIRIVDPGLEKYHGYSSCPLHYLTRSDIPFFYEEYWIKFLMIFISCSSHLNTTLYNGTDFYRVYSWTAFCGHHNSNSLSSVQQKYSYVILGEGLWFNLIEDSCSVKRVTLVSSNAPVVGDNGFLDYSYGFELLWYGVHCRRCIARGGECDPNMETGSVVCISDCYLWDPSTIRKVRCKFRDFSIFI